MEPRILIKYASRSRPGRFLEGLESIYKLAGDPNSLQVCCILDDDDPTAADYREILRRPQYAWVWPYYGKSSSKIDAINRPLPPFMPWDILVNFSDDMRFTVFGYDHLIREGVRCNGSDVFLHFPDSTAKNMLPTMSVMDRAYFDRDGYIYHPSYKSLWCDNEAMDVAKMRGRYVYMGVQIFDHYHPSYGHVPWDEQYERQQKFWDEDEKNYYDRKANNFYLNETTQYSDPDSNGTGKAA